MDLSTAFNTTYTMLVEKLQIGMVRIQRAWLTPFQSPYDQKIDVTRTFTQIVQSGVVMVNRTVTLTELVPPRSGWWFVGRHQPSMDGEWWLSVQYAIVGGAMYITVYKLPDTTITFPPANIMSSHEKITPLEKSIISAEIVTHSSDGHECILDITDVYKQYANGNNVEMLAKIRNLIFSTVMSEMTSADMTLFVLGVLQQINEPKQLRLAITKGDGTIVYDP